MDPLKVAARFVAFACYLNAGTHSPKRGRRRIARSNWKRFLPYANADLGRFLTAAEPSATARTRQYFGRESTRARCKLAI